MMRTHCQVCGRSLTAVWIEKAEIDRLRAELAEARAEISLYRSAHTQRLDKLAEVREQRQVLVSGIEAAMLKSTATAIFETLQAALRAVGEEPSPVHLGGLTAESV